MGKPLEKLEKLSIQRMRRANKEAADLLQKQILENATLTDHTLDALEKLGHPYAIRDPRRIHRPDFQVHTQSTRLKEAVRVQVLDKNRIIVGVDDVAVPYIRHVIRGTQFMVARDFITGSFNQIRSAITRIFDKALKDAENDNTDKTKTEL